jgi:RNA polymerase sigma factor (sigma-70 family)
MEVNENFSKKALADLELVKLAQSGDQMAYSKLLEKYRESVYYTMLRMVKNPDDADDLTIEAFGKAFNRIHQYSPNFAFSTWLFKIASNNCIDFIRKKRIKTSSMDTGMTTSDGDVVFYDASCDRPDPSEHMIQKQKAAAMRDVVDQLKPRYKELIKKRYFEELSYEEIAEELNIPLGTVKAQLFRARDFLSNLMENKKHTI